MITHTQLILIDTCNHKIQNMNTFQCAIRTRGQEATVIPSSVYTFFALECSWRSPYEALYVYVHCSLYMYELLYTEKEVVWLGDIFWKGSMEFSSHRDFITPNVSACS